VVARRNEMGQITEVTRIIGGVLTPAIMVSCCGLLLLSLQNKYGRIIDRIRQFNTEKRTLLTKEVLTDTDKTRLESIKKQLEILVKRGKYQKNATLCLYIGVISFVMTSIIIALSFGISTVTMLAILTFGLGMFLVLVGAIFAALEIRISYRTTLLEIEVEEKLAKN
jgi:hypothetical protein